MEVYEFNRDRANLFFSVYIKKISSTVPHADLFGGELQEI